MLRLRGRALRPVLSDNSALLSGVLLGAALPPGSAWWLIAVGMVAAIVVAKQLYGGLGHNLFNPAMVGYALLLVSFPARMSLWPLPGGLFGPEAASLGQTLASVAGRIPLAELDALSGATPLDAFSHKPEGLMVSEFWASEPLPAGMLSAVQQVSLAWLAGGAILLAKGIIGWRIPLAMLATLLVGASLMLAASPSHQPGPLFHLLTGASAFGAFFIATDPVSAATSRRGKLIYGMGIGLLVLIIRGAGAYPDALAFAVLLMNLAVPLIDRYSVPRAYGQRHGHGTDADTESGGERL
ncbi:MAG TPA: RnfABCDGE type electron transport complex subunit D [Halomonas sp.]|nr:RnfABCDGE type electron transport complex subunit D [Halomonas sp.]